MDLRLTEQDVDTGPQSQQRVGLHETNKATVHRVYCLGTPCRMDSSSTGTRHRNAAIGWLVGAYGALAQFSSFLALKVKTIL